MVKICSMTNYPKDNEEKYKESFKMYIYSIFDNKLNYLSFIILFINVSNYSY